MSDEYSSGAAPTASMLVQRLTIILAVLLVVGSLFWAADVYRRGFGWLLFPQQIVSGLIGISTALVFLHIPAGGGARVKVPWFDAIAAIAGLIVSFYVAVNYEQMSLDVPFQKLDGIICGIITTILILEGLRRVAGKVLLGIVLVFFAYALLGEYVPGDLQGRHIDPRDLVLYATLDLHGLVGPIVGIALTIVVTFIFFGTLLFRSGGSNFFTDISLALMGNYRGGSAKIAVSASALFGSISGSAVANVASTGVITIPMMKDGGYRPQHAGAIEAVASTGGQLMPPIMGASAFLMAEFLEISYAEVVIAAIIPAVLYYVALFIQVDLEAARSGITRVDKSLIPPIKEVFTAGWFFPIPFAVLIGGLFGLNQPPELAAIFGCATLLLFGFVFGYRGKRLNLRILGAAISATGFSVIEIVMIAAAASFIIAILNISGLGFALTLALVKLGAGNLGILLVLAAGISIVLGMGMPTIGVYVLLASLVAPALSEVGVPPLAAHLFVLYFGMMSMITPPVAIAAYAGATIAKADPIKTCFSAIRFGWPAYVVPFLFVLSPLLLFNGPKLEVAWAVATAIGGVWLVTVSVIGYFSRNLDIITRLLFAVAGFALLIPADVIPAGMWVNIGGLIAGVLLMLREIASRRRREARKV
ncbi:MAG: TRAP transporter fused permease subunit [Rhodospirillaceae bacterium]|nr:TRAP transporter fused permease subunit [Rhodospirillaceae bacterium]